MPKHLSQALIIVSLIAFIAAGLSLGWPQSWLVAAAILIGLVAF